MSSLQNSLQSVKDDTNEINQCLRFKEYLVQRYEETDRLKYHCAANVMHNVINDKIIHLKTYCQEKMRKNQIRHEKLKSENRENYESSIGKLSNKLANLSTILQDHDGDKESHQLPNSNRRYPKRVVRQNAKTITLTMSDQILMDIPSECCTENQVVFNKNNQKNKNVNVDILNNIVRTGLKDPYKRLLIKNELEN